MASGRQGRGRGGALRGSRRAYWSFNLYPDPEAAGKAISGQDPNTLLAPALGLAVLAFYAVAAAVAGSLATSRRDFA